MFMMILEPTLFLVRRTSGNLFVRRATLSGFLKEKDKKRTTTRPVLRQNAAGNGHSLSHWDPLVTLVNAGHFGHIRSHLSLLVTFFTAGHTGWSLLEEHP